MLNLIKKLLAFLMPIFRTAVVQSTADAINKFAYPDRDTRRPLRYNRNVPRSSASRGKFNEYAEKDVAETMNLFGEGSGFHDVLMVAFDLTGPSASLVHEWLHNQMPSEIDDYAGISLDSWWVANDERFDRSDCDSAVFVAKGNQEAARELLREHGLVNDDTYGIV